MPASDQQIAELRRMTDEPTTATYSDDALQLYVERYCLVDSLGQKPVYFNGVQVVVNPYWLPTYDLHHAAADIWSEKASKYALAYDQNADGAALTRSQMHTHCMQQTRFHLSRRSAGTITLSPEPLKRPVVENPDHAQSNND